MSVVPNKAPTVYMAWQASSGTLPTIGTTPDYVLTRSVSSTNGTVVAFAAALVGTGGGIFYSTNSGQSFIQTPTFAKTGTGSGGPDYAMNSLAITADGTTIYAIAAGTGIFKYIIGSHFIFCPQS